MQRVALTKHADQPIEFSRIVYGMWRVSDDTDTSPAHVQAKIEACLDQGITTFDQADIYGGYRCEQLLGEALKDAPYLRSQMEIVTKCDILLMTDAAPERRIKYYDTSAKHISASIDQSLINMNIEQIDCLLIHRPDPLMDHHETGAALDAAVSSGKVGSIGVSNFKPHDWHLLQSAMTTQLVTNQLEVSVLEHAPFTNGDIAFHQQQGISPMAWSPLGGGSLFDQSRADLQELRNCLARIADGFGKGLDAIAIAWLLAHPASIMPVMGTNNMDRIKSLSDAAKIDMDRQTWFEIYVAAMGQEVP
ncbi:MAG: aldo/keto reductase [Rhizobiaceae bacterium]